MQARTLAWLDRVDFYGRTGLPRSKLDRDNEGGHAFPIPALPNVYGPLAGPQLVEEGAALLGNEPLGELRDDASRLPQSPCRCESCGRTLPQRQ